MKLPFWPQISEHKDIKLRLNNVTNLLSRIGNPHQSLPPVIHVAGTNGKGSTIAYMGAILKDAGYKVHCYTSPHLVNFNERIVLNGKQIEDKFLNKLLKECKLACETDPKIEVTFFEGVTAAAFLAFSRVKSDILLMETGMGGRLDATNVVEKPLATIITPISFDHGQFLGNSLDKIAMEKCGIIKDSVPLIVARQEEPALETIKSQGQKKNAPLYIFNNQWQISKKDQKLMTFTMNNHQINLPYPCLEGDHQIENAGTAIAALLSIKNFKIKNDNIKNGLLKAKWSARLEQINKGKLYNLLPKNYQLFVDGGHNPHAAKAIAEWINNQNNQNLKNDKPKVKIYLICAMSKDKNSSDFLKHFVGLVDFVSTMNIKDNPKSKSAIQLAKYALYSGLQSCNVENFQEAFEDIRALHENDVQISKSSFIKRIFGKKPKKKPAIIIICGSLYLAGQFLAENS